VVFRGLRVRVGVVGVGICPMAVAEAVVAAVAVQADYLAEEEERASRSWS
jgi:hypothetical protein